MTGKQYFPQCLWYFHAPSAILNVKDLKKNDTLARVECLGFAQRGPERITCFINFVKRAAYIQKHRLIAKKRKSCKHPSSSLCSAKGEPYAYQLIPDMGKDRAISVCFDALRIVRYRSPSDREKNAGAWSAAKTTVGIVVFRSAICGLDWVSGFPPRYWKGGRAIPIPMGPHEGDHGQGRINPCFF